MLKSLRRVSLADALSVNILSTLQTSIERRVRHPHLWQILERFATYVGASPYLAPAALAVIEHVELTEGVWYPQGGVYAIARAYEKLTRELGVEFRFNTRIEEICVHGRQVSAGLAHHNIFFSSDYRREFEQLFTQKVIPDDPTLYLCITAKIEASHAPAGCENWFVMVNAPALPLDPGAAEMPDPARLTGMTVLRPSSAHTISRPGRGCTLRAAAPTPAAACRW